MPLKKIGAEQVVIAGLIEPTHNERFISVLNTYYHNLRVVKDELNELPLAAEEWINVLNQ